jgi:hypothetical protein
MKKFLNRIVWWWHTTAKPIDDTRPPAPKTTAGTPGPNERVVELTPDVTPADTGVSVLVPMPDTQSDVVTVTQTISIRDIWDVRFKK